MTLTEIKNKFEKEFGIEYPFDNPLSGHERIKSFITQTLTDTLEGLRMEKKDHECHSDCCLAYGGDTAYCDCSVPAENTGFNNAVDLLDVKINSILQSDKMESK